MSAQPHEHPRRLADAHAVTPLELFFDLVFVFALTQVTGLLANDLTWVGMLRGLAVLTVVWWAWVGYSWLTNTIRIDDDVSSRLVLLLAMAAMLVVGLAAPNAFGDAAIVFGIAYLIVRVLHLLLYAVTTRSDPEVFGAVARLAPGMLTGALLILIAGFLPAGPFRAALWALAIVIDLAAPLLAGTSGWKIDARHFSERHGLIIIIALGESLIAVGVSAAAEPLSPGLITAALLGVALIAGMWWLYFDVVALAAERRLASLTGSAQAAMARDSYSYLHLPMVAGIVLVALGLKKSMVHLDEPLKLIISVALFGGLALYLVAHLAFRLRNMGTWNVQRLVAAAVLLALIPVGTLVPAIVSVTAATAATVALVTFEAVRFRAARHQLRLHTPDHAE
ncbi:MAG: low temperature requirement protein A [Actinomycetales bacterium]|nr:low temperature requirement protein A [Actinomycetales bacterium]